MEDVSMKHSSNTSLGNITGDTNNSFTRDFSELMAELKGGRRSGSKISGSSSLILGDEEVLNSNISDNSSDKSETDDLIADVRSVDSSHSSVYNDMIVDDALQTPQTNGTAGTANSEETEDVDMDAPSETETAQSDAPPPPKKQKKKKMIPVDIVWEQGGDKVYVTGSFTGWTKMIGLLPIPNKPGILHVRLKLPPGVHRFRFVVSNELRYSDFLPTATDQMGNFVNYLEVRPTDSTEFTTHLEEDASVSDAKLKKMSAQSRIALKIKNEPDNVGDGFTRFYDEELKDPEIVYTTELPAIFTDPRLMEKYYTKLDYERNRNRSSYLLPNQLPPHLEHAILNDFPNIASTTNEIAHGGSLSTPNHVVLNHLLTSSIKHGTLGLATAVRYRDKYITQVYYSPIKK
ncbi:hypothetical protein DAKH74_008300 [Maudiozyma humilis]|uniref:Association with the SNF1 complex (ASC) domain-containing protein n=1 Tax=Maudiozyma humilis TaxID=51915 RepID=A0AAV5RUK5_MAUHU|nr:hypothetical protein DAKH74_008300 [Kazachstania humilis]